MIDEDKLTSEQREKLAHFATKRRLNEAQVQLLTSQSQTLALDAALMAQEKAAFEATLPVKTESN